MKLAIKVNDAFGSRLALPDTLGITTKWQDAGTRNGLTMAQVAEIQKRLNVPDEQIWNLLGATRRKKLTASAVLRSNQRRRWRRLRHSGGRKQWEP